MTDQSTPPDPQEPVSDETTTDATAPHEPTSEAESAEMDDEPAATHDESETDEPAATHDESETDERAASQGDRGRSSFDPRHWPPPGPGAPMAPSPVRRLYRSRHDRKIGGVSAGVAEFLGIDPTIVRLATLLFAITGIGIVAYLAAWLIVPLRPEGLVEPPRGTPVADERTLTIGFGVAALAVAIGIATGSWGVLAVAMIAGGVWLLSEQTTSPSRTAAATDMSGAATGAGSQSAYGAAPYGPMPYTAPTRSSVDTPPQFPPPVGPTAYGGETPPQRRGPQRITWIVLALLSLLCATGVLAAAGDWWDVSATMFVGIGVAIIAVGVVLGQLRGGGARGLIPLLILATLALFPVSAVDGLLDEGVGDAVYRPSAIEELESRYEHGIGKMTVDLSQLDLDGRSETIDIDLGIGELVVIVSEEVGGSAQLRATAGEVSHRTPTTRSLFTEDGLNVETGTLLLAGDGGELDLDISVGLGTAELRLTQE